MANTPKIDIMGYVGSKVHFCRGGTLFHVRDGLGRLAFYRQPQKGDKYKDGGYCQVWMGDELLAAPYIEYCPSYAGHLVRGYGNGIMGDDGLRAASEAANAAFRGMPDAIERISPLLGLLPSGMYLAADFDLFPTCSCHIYSTGRVAPFFWDEPDPRESVEEIQSGGWVCGEPYHYDAPMFLMPGQRAASLNPERVDYYRKKLREEGDDFPRCIAVYLNGAYALLLDGHHKATAAAAEGERIRTIVLFSVDMKKQEADSLQGAVRLYLRHREPMYQCVRLDGIPVYNGEERLPKGEDLRRQKAGEKHGKLPARGLYLCDGQENIRRRTFGLQDIPPTPLKPVDENSMLPWGKVPEAYLQRLKEYPTSWELMKGTDIPPDRIKSAYRDFVMLCSRKPGEMMKGSREYDSIIEEKRALRERLLNYLKLFPESKWLNEAQRECLNESE